MVPKIQNISSICHFLFIDNLLIALSFYVSTFVLVFSIIMVGEKEDVCDLVLPFCILDLLSLEQLHGSYNTCFSFASFGNNNNNRCFVLSFTGLHQSHSISKCYKHGSILSIEKPDQRVYLLSIDDHSVAQIYDHLHHALLQHHQSHWEK
jgi:hypothetical protein